MSTDSVERRYRGESVDARRADRHCRFLDAALSEFTEVGYATTSVTSICRAAGLSRRQFYELFADREALLLDLYAKIQSDARDAVTRALEECESREDGVLAATAMAAYMQSVGTDPRRAEVSFVQIVGVSPEVEQRRFDGRQVWADFFTATAARFTPGRVVDPERERFVTIGFIGALTSVVHRWSTSSPRPEPEAVAAILADILLAFVDL
ncbi:TetR/AcrR family transcriptional regulator [Gordonia soli]|uniref:Putative TetR family transcriptional regulator n=1 Tax=Gordonia soli NBRC 108243 TaxID=1223545 RepID=M0QQL1_9ACTN|nr:TetR/AcrR family transcriptional regulator [Gordonia soli]GAC70965.1 putative TetR family transcriptional regulator [Gordonia soli NBRC 108243]